MRGTQNIRCSATIHIYKHGGLIHSNEFTCLDRICESLILANLASAFYSQMAKTNGHDCDQIRTVCIYGVGKVVIHLSSFNSTLPLRKNNMQNNEKSKQHRRLTPDFSTTLSHRLS